MPQVTQRASAFVFPVIAMADKAEEARPLDRRVVGLSGTASKHFHLRSITRRRCLATAKRGLVSCSGNGEIWLHKSRFSLRCLSTSTHKGYWTKELLAGLSGLQSNAGREWRLLWVMYHA